MRERRRSLAILRPGATATGATTELTTLDIRMRSRGGFAAEVTAPLVADAVGTLPTPGSRRLAQTLSTLMAAIVAVVLMIACVNVGHLLLARSALRQREFPAIRRALGASRARLLRQLLTEALVLAVAGTLCGVVLAMWAGHLLERSVPQAACIFAVQVDLLPDWRALVFAAGICVVTTVLCGLPVPAWRVSRTSRMMVVQGSVGETTRRKPVGLVVQVVMSLVLLFIGASFLGRVVRLHGTYPGFAVAGRLSRRPHVSPFAAFLTGRAPSVVCTRARPVTVPSGCAPRRRHLIVAADSCGLGPVPRCLQTRPFT